MRGDRRRWPGRAPMTTRRRRGLVRDAACATRSAARTPTGDRAAARPVPRIEARVEAVAGPNARAGGGRPGVLRDANSGPKVSPRAPHACSRTSIAPAQAADARAPAALTMRVVIDLQACQSASRTTRYRSSFVRTGAGDRRRAGLARGLARAQRRVPGVDCAAAPRVLRSRRQGTYRRVRDADAGGVARHVQRLAKPCRRADPRDLSPRSASGHRARGKPVRRAGRRRRCVRGNDPLVRTRRQRRSTTSSRWRAARACRPRRASTGTSESSPR